MKGEAKTLLALGAGTLAIFVIGIFLLSGSQKGPNVEASPSVLGANDSYKIQGEGDKVTLVEFGDFQCPACGKANPLIKRLLEDYKGKITFIFRHFPLPSHANSQVAAEAAEAAGEQGKFYEMVDKLYSNQNQWSDSRKAVDIFVDYAKDLGLDTGKFRQAVESNKFADKIKRDSKDGTSVGVSSTPTFFLNTEMMKGLPDYNTLKNKVDYELNK